MSREDDDGLGLDGASAPSRLLASNDVAGADTRRLLSALPNHEPLPAAKARVRRALARAEKPKRAPSWRTVPVIALVLLASTAAVASAGLGGFSKLRLALVAGGEDDTSARTHDAEKKVPPTSPAPEASAARAAEPTPVLPEPASAPAPESIAPPEPAPQKAVAAPKATVAPKGEATVAPVPSPDRAPPPPPAPPAEVSQGAALVLDAMRALRKEHDPARAARKLAEYRSHHAGGALDEEALALAIEASVATNDGTSRRLASDYVARYPAGRFAKSAEAVLAEK